MLASLRNSGEVQFLKFGFLQFPASEHFRDEEPTKKEMYKQETLRKIDWGLMIMFNCSVYIR